MPKLKKSASSAISSARIAARGVSIIVPMMTSGFFFSPLPASSISSSTQRAGEVQLLAGDGERDHDLDDRVLAALAQVGGRLQQRPHLHARRAPA